MAEKSSFFNSVNGDRKYKASDFAEFFNSFITNGVFPNPSTKLQVFANNNMTITIKAGKAWINGYNYYNDSDLILNIDVADGVLNRIDRVVLRMDTVGRAINAKVKKGTFASSPIAPALQRDADGYELALADIYVVKGAVSIVQTNITDLRLNADLCDLVSFIAPIDTTAIFNQYLDWYNTKTSQYQTEMSNMEQQFQNDFNAWFNSIKNTLSGDAAGNLLNMINDLAGVGRTNQTVKGVSDALESHKADNMYKTAGGTATAIALNINGTLVTGYPITFIASANNNGSATTINNKKLYKPGTTTAPNLISGKAYTVWYNATGDNGNGCFFIKASAEGDVTPDKVLANYKYSSDDVVGGVGTMPNRAGSVLGSGATTNGSYTGNKFEYDIVLPTSGYMDNTTKLHQTLTNLLPSNFKKGVTIPEIEFTGTMVEADNLDGRPFYVAGSGTPTTDKTLLEVTGSGWIISLMNYNSSSYAYRITIDGSLVVNDSVNGNGSTLFIYRFNSSLKIEIYGTSVKAFYILD